MDISLKQLPEILKIVFSVLSGLTALLPSSFWGKIKPTKTERVLFGAFAVAIVLAIWPVDRSYCGLLLTYVWSVIGLLLYFVVALGVDAVIVRQFGHDQPNRKDDSIEPNTILGGPELTSGALEVQAREPHWSTQEIFEHLDYDPHKTWKRWPRTLLIVGERFLANSKLMALLLAIVVFVAYLFLWNEINRTHRALTLRPSTDQLLLEGRSLSIEPDLQECRQDIKWEIEGLSSQKERGVLGEISDTGTYSSPMQIEQDVELYVVATPLQHPYERKKLKIQLRSHPNYSEPHHAEGSDKKNRSARFAIEVIDRRYSWVIGKNILEGVDGPTFARRMAAEGMFSGFERIICIGAASREYRSLSEEDRRSLERANTLGGWVDDTLPRGRARVYGLKIGRYNEEERLNPMETARERQVVIVGVLPGSDDHVDLLEALRDAFVQKRREEPLLGMYLDKYPFENWELQKIGL